MNLNCLLFNDFETLDLFGPVEVFGKLEGCDINYFSLNGGIIKSRQNAQIVTEKIDKIGKIDTLTPAILIVPGGKGTRTLVNDTDFITALKILAEQSTWCLTVCTGSALLAKTGLLDDCNATSNKNAFEWVKSMGKAHWKYKARWVVDKKYYTSSGISAGIDMSLGFVADNFGTAKANEIAKMMEYVWKDTKDDDPFAINSP
jgi:putative intracellular protease/amidase